MPHAPGEQLCIDDANADMTAWGGIMEASWRHHGKGDTRGGQREQYGRRVCRFHTLLIVQRSKHDPFAHTGKRNTSRVAWSTEVPSCVARPLQRYTTT
jgi:hypothetical protein